MWLWKYKITGYGLDVGKFMHEGVICGENFTEAVNSLEDYYMNEVETLYIKPIGDTDKPFILKKQYGINEEVME
jgi:hypothetical protein